MKNKLNAVEFKCETNETTEINEATEVNEATESNDTAELTKVTNTKDEYRNIVRFCFSFIIWIINTTSWGYVWFTKYADYISQPFYFRGDVLVVIIYGLLLYFFTAFYGGYKIGYHKRGEVIYSNILALLILNILTYAQTSLLTGWFAPPLPILTMTLIQTALIIIQTIKKDGVILCDLPSNLRNDVLKFCFQNNIQAYITPKIPDIIMRGAAEVTLFDTPLLHSRNNGLTIEQRFIKRAMDIILSILGLLIVLPLMILIAIIIKIYDKGSIFYSQERLTKDGKVFRLYKFRSMIENAENENGAQLAVENDTRITPVGKILSRFRLDELRRCFVF